ncbi:hypothetical protein MASR2M48_01670 [Spirochaetota bacterium]
MKFSIRSCLLLFAMAIIGVHAWADASAVAVIEYTSGDDVIVIRSGKRVVMHDPIGVELLEGDQIQTGKGVFLELRLIHGSSSGGAIIKLAENTTFALDTMTEGQTALRLVYGRVRAKVEKLTGTDAFSMRSTNVIAGVRGTDFGLDVIASRSAMSINTSKTYCFEGTLEVHAINPPRIQSGETLEMPSQNFTLQGGEMLTVEFVNGTTSAVKTSVADDIRQFWMINDYVIRDDVASSPEESDPFVLSEEDRQALFDEGYAAGLQEARGRFAGDDDFVPEGFLSKQEAEAIRKASLLQSGGGLAGGLLGIGGAALAVRGFILVNAGDPTGGIVYLQAGAIISSMAIPFLALSLFARP